MFLSTFLIGYPEEFVKINVLLSVLRSAIVHGVSTPGKSCTDGTAFLPACITESDSFLEATVLRRAQMNDKKLVDDQF